jgi:nucleotide-binding universal stress UspA family protein
MGFASRVLLEVASRALLLVIGSRGLGQIRGRLLDSVGLHAIAQATCPVVVVRAEAHLDGPVIAAVDGSRPSRSILAQAIEEARLRSAQLDVIWALGSRDEAACRDGRVAGLSAHAEMMVTGMLAELSPGSRDLKVDAHFPVGAPMETLITASAGAQLLVMGSRGAGLLTGMRLGSVSHAVAAHGQCPVMVMPVAGG